MLSLKVKLAAAALFAVHVAGTQLLHQQPAQPKHGPARVPEAHAEQAAPDQANLKPEAYWVPWDNWLKKHGSPIGGQDVWTASTETGIRGEMLICVTYAETNLGKVAQRGSTTNVGSVGSYDATNTTHAAGSVVEGLAMIGRTLNNPMLGKKTTVAQLSRRSEPYGPVYAESRENWERNVLTCLTKITGKPITNQWEFRR